MKKQPIDSLSIQDKYIIKKYIELYAGGIECGPLDVVFNYWNKSKRRLYHAFNNQLRVKKKIKIEKNYSTIEQDLYSIYNPYYIHGGDIDYYASLKDDFLPEKEDNFPLDFTIQLCLNDKILKEEKRILSRLLAYKNIIKGTIQDNVDLHLKNYSFTCKTGMKTIRTIQKCLKAIQYPHMDCFQRWVNKINLIDKSSVREETLVLSIHPIDFMTMSDNNCNWSSCMSWTKDGCYHTGTIEMLNSNLAVVAYLENKIPFTIELDEDNILTMPNKKWRQLFFVSKDIILGGKAYPYQNKEITFEVLSLLRKLVDKFNWKYSFINQQYQDIKNFEGNFFLKYVADPHIKKKNKKNYKIITYMNGMYHDMIEDTGTSYWCCRNKVSKGLKLNLSGPVTCLCCGKIVEDTVNIYDPDHLKGVTVCWECVRKRCEICHKISYNSFYHMNHYFCSQSCLDESVIIKNASGQKIVILKTDFLSNSDKRYFIITKNSSIRDKLKKEIEEYFDCVYSIPSSESKRKVLYDTNMLQRIEQLLFKLKFIKGRDYLIKEVPGILYKKNIVSSYRKTMRRVIITNRRSILIDTAVAKKEEISYYHLFQYEEGKIMQLNEQAFVDFKTIKDIHIS